MWPAFSHKECNVYASRDFAPVKLLSNLHIFAYLGEVEDLGEAATGDFAEEKFNRSEDPSLKSRSRITRYVCVRMCIVINDEMLESRVSRALHMWIRRDKKAKRRSPALRESLGQKRLHRGRVPIATIAI